MAAELVLSGTTLPTKQDIALQVAKIASLVEDNEVNALLTYGQLSALETEIKNAKDKIKQAAVDEAEKYGKSFEVFGASFQVKETAVKYDFSGDGEWQSYQDVIDDAKARQKGREVTLKALGNIPKSSTTTIAVSLK